jgi:hypothetical protein
MKREEGWWKYAPLVWQFSSRPPATPGAKGNYRAGLWSAEEVELIQVGCSPGIQIAISDYQFQILPWPPQSILIPTDATGGEGVDGTQMDTSYASSPKLNRRRTRIAAPPQLLGGKDFK